jgi:photosystem II stability/assembly factor-like uncharacterized protein
MNIRFFTIIYLLVFFSSASVDAQSSKSNGNTNEFNDYFKPLKWRCIGPFRGGRSGAGAGVIDDPMTYYSGITGGGLWKTEDMGITWNNISDGYFTSGSVGAICVAPSDANVVFVGMGEHAVRGVMTHGGDGVFKSTDAGKTWKKMGLELTQHIARIIIHPQDPNTVFVAAQGPLYGRSNQRGLFKTTDGGLTWKNVLYVDDKSGCNEISMDAINPRIMYASMWEHGRLPWQVISGGPGSGLYKSTDSGEHWEKLTEGLPKELGKMSIAVCPSNSEKVYALIESNWEKEEGGLYVSNNAGKSWSQVSKDHRIIQRSWYYIELFVDPKNENLVYVLSAPFMRSMDGGNTWEDVSGTHGDYHNLWINPKNSSNMIVSDDGGSAVTFNRGKSWSHQNLPTAQFYRINVDNLFPYNIYGGQQDNSSVKIASRNISGGSITKDDWTYSAGGESAFIAFNPDDPQYVMGGSYQGTIELIDTKAKVGTQVMAAPIQYLGRDAKDMKYRFNWNAPIICSKHDPKVFYHGSQHVLKTNDYGKSWTEASPDLTRNEKSKQGRPGVPLTNEAVGAENYGTLSYITESPIEKGVIYTGSDDGLIHITKDNGASWQNITPKGLEECLINAIEVSPFDKATAYAATTRYKFNDHTPGLYKTIDYGKTWVKINTGIPNGSFTRVVREDDKKKDLLYAGTENGIYISWNGGKEWTPFQLNLPVVPITDLKVHQGNLIASTSGRSFWILDDLNVIRQYNKDQKTLMLMKSSDAILTNSSSDLDNADNDFKGQNTASGINAPSGVLFYFHLPEVKENDIVVLKIQDADGKLINTFSSKADSTYLKYDGGPRQDPILSKNKGLNRFNWNMRHATLPGVPNAYIEASYRGHKVAPGKYTAILSCGEATSTQTIEILKNPLYNMNEVDYQEYNATMISMETEVKTMHDMINSLNAKREQLQAILSNLSNDDKMKPLKVEAASLIAKMKSWDEDMIQRRSKAYDDVENFPNKFSADYMYLMNQTESDIPRVNQSNKELIKSMNAQWAELKSRGLVFLDKEIPGLNVKLWAAGVGALWMK